MRLLIWSAKALFLNGFLFAFFVSKVFAANPAENVTWYENGQPIIWKLESDKKLYKIQQGFSEKSNQAKQSSHSYDIISNNIISSKSDLLQGFLSVALDSGWITPITVVKPINSPLSHKEIYIDDVLLLQFKTGVVKKSEINRLESNYNIQLVTKEFLESKTLIFRNLNKDRFSNSALLSAKIYESENHIVAEIQPNRMNLFEPMGTVNDVDIEKSWFLEKGNSSVSCSSVSEEATADAEITQAWANGATGKNTRVAVIDFYGFDYNHPDMQGQMIDGWDCINNRSYNSNNFYYTNPNQAHGMAVAGVIAARANNGVGSAGVAYDTKIIPLLIDGSEVSVVLAIQKAISSGMNADVINCSFGSYFPSPAIRTEIENAIQQGRNGKGTVVVASHGNDFFDDVEYPQYPSSYEEVISVGASTPDDKRKTPGDGWDVSGSWGTNYGDKLQISAPGVCIFTTDISGNDGYGNSDYISFQKTSAAAPIVSGVVALMIGQDAELSHNEILEQLFTTADKVNSGSASNKYDYNYSAEYEGRSRETGYGRVNALKAINGEYVTVGVDDYIKVESIDVQMNTFIESTLQIKFSNQNDIERIGTRIVDLSGKTMYFEPVRQVENLNIDTQSWATGMYLVQIIENNQVLETHKVIKANK